VSLYRIDINADLGEGAGNDAQIMPLISSCNIACGGHAGDAKSINQTLKLAKTHRVKVGAHPSFPDRDNFGRKVLTMTKNDLYLSIKDQIMSFVMHCKSQDVFLHHIKLHGALYNYSAIDAPTADAVVEAILSTKMRPMLYVPEQSVLAKKAANLLPLKYEGFIDRNYQDDLSLVPRSQANALIVEPRQAWMQLLQMVTQGSVLTVKGNYKMIHADTFCVHGDHPNSVEILEYIHQQMPERGIELG
jgi:5-oxoprolinase (ATP-hydrolysing) subunit A